MKSLYGIQQEPKQWHSKFDHTMLKNELKINKCDKCVYIKNDMNHEFIFCLYVYDMLIMSKSIDDINATKRMLSSNFNIKDLGVAGLILGARKIKTVRPRR